MLDLIIVIFWFVAAFSCLFNMSGFALGHTYDYQYRRKTYHGTKTLLWLAILVTMYYLPWQRWGVFV